MPLPRFLRFRFSLRALLVFLTLFGLWGGYHANHGWKERRAVEVLRIHDAGWSSLYSDDPHDRWYRTRLIYEAIVRKIWREQFLDRVSLRSTGGLTWADDEVLDALDDIPNLDRIELAPSRVSTEQKERLYRKGVWTEKVRMPDGALRRVLGNRQLKELELFGWILSDEDCSVVGQHESLMGLSVEACELSEDGFAKLMTLPRLRGVIASYCNVTGCRLESAHGSQSLKNVRVERSPVGPGFAMWLGSCPNIELLHIHSDSVNDEFIANLGPHPSLSDLGLGSANITDSGYANYAKMPRLTPHLKQHLQSKPPKIQVP
jgi:hypothetical protein